MRDIVKELIKNFIWALLISSITFILLFSLLGCDEGHYLEAERIEKQVLTTTPYLVNVFDCTERANMAKALLIQKDYKVYDVVQLSPDKESDVTHDCVKWEKGNESGTILCKSGWRFFSTNKIKL